jgi:hypothetical protein
MEFSEDINALKKLRKTSWKFQQTFRTPAPRQNLGSFVRTIVLATPSPGVGSFTIGQAVMFADHLMAFFAENSLAQVCRSGTTVTTASQDEAEGLLVAAFSDPLDFLFAPEKKPFVLYADHDQFTTFFAQTRSNLNRIIGALLSNGFEQIPDYQRQL